LFADIRYVINNSPFKKKI